MYTGILVNWTEHVVGQGVAVSQRTVLVALLAVSQAAVGGLVSYQTLVKARFQEE